MKHVLQVKGMHCKSCVTLVTDALTDLGASNIKIDLNEKKQEAKIAFEYAGDIKNAITVIEGEGYKV